MGLHVHYGPALSSLGDAMLETLSTPLADPLQAELIGVPTLGIADWLRRHIASTLGIAANLDMVFPGAFMARLLDLPPGPSPWDVDRLTWSVLRELALGDVYVPAPVDYRTARRIADLFDHYGVNRPAMLAQWSRGVDGDGLETNDGGLATIAAVPEGHRWQAELWRAVRASINSPSPAETMITRLADIEHGGPPGDVPSRIVLFGVSGLTPAQLQVLSAVGRHRAVTVCLVHPSPAAWQRTPHRLGGWAVPRSGVDATSAVRVPALASWSKPNMEASALLSGSAAELIVCPRQPTESRSTTLRAVQRALAADDLDASPAVDLDDSIQLHACHGARRQIEVLRDSIGELMVADPSLHAHDVVVVCPDIVRFAPLIGSTFAKGLLPLPVRVSDPGNDHDNEVAEALVHIIALLSSRFRLADVLEVCALPAVARRNALGIDDLALIQRWADDLGIRWGIDAQHRQNWLTTSIPDGTWDTALDSLLAGIVVPAAQPREIADGIVPFDDIDTDAAATVGHLASLIDRLRHVARRCVGPLDIHQWVGVAADIVGQLLAPPPDQPWQAPQVLSVLDDIAASADTCVVPIERADFELAMRSHLLRRRARLHLRSGAVNVVAPAAVRHLPARVIAVLGFNDAALTRNAATDGDDVLAVRPCVGERDLRAQARGFVMDSLLAATDAFVVTFDGADLTTNRQVPNPVALTELLDVVAGVTSNSVPTALIRRHPRFAHTGAGRTFDPSVVAAAHALASVRAQSAVDPERRVLDIMIPEKLTLQNLIDSTYRPSWVVLHERLDVALPRPFDEIDPNVRLSASPLERSQLGRSIVDMRLRAGLADRSTEGIRRMAELDGRLPPRQLRFAVVDSVHDEVVALLGTYPDVLAAAMYADDSAPIELDIPLPAWCLGDDQVAASGAVTVELRDTVDRLSDTHLILLDYVRPRNRPLLQAAFTLAALVAAYPDQDWQATTVTRAATGTGLPTVTDIGIVGGYDAARQLLAVGLDLRLRSLREPLPLFEHSSRLLATTGTITNEEDFENLTRGDMRDRSVAMLWEGFRTEDILAIPYSPYADPALRPVTVAGFEAPSRAASLATFLWEAVSGFVEFTDRKKPK